MNYLSKYLKTSAPNSGALEAEPTSNEQNAVPERGAPPEIREEWVARALKGKNLMTSQGTISSLYAKLVDDTERLYSNNPLFRTRTSEEAKQLVDTAIVRCVAQQSWDHITNELSQADIKRMLAFCQKYIVPHLQKTFKSTVPDIGQVWRLPKKAPYPSSISMKHLPMEERLPWLIKMLKATNISHENGTSSLYEALIRDTHIIYLQNNPKLQDLGPEKAEQIVQSALNEYIHTRWKSVRNHDESGLVRESQTAVRTLIEKQIKGLESNIKESNAGSMQVARGRG